MQTSATATSNEKVHGGNFIAGFWRLADPKISLASMASIFLGTCAAASMSRLDFGWLGMTLVGIFALEVAKNASGEIFDFAADTVVAPIDRSPFSGGKRVLVDGLLTRNQTMFIAAVGYSIGIAAGLVIVTWREPGVFWLGVVGIFLAFFYNAPPLRFSYCGLGELAVAICYGPLIAGGTYLVQRGRIDIAPLLTSIPLGLLIANFLWINEFPDTVADAAVGKRTLVVQLGRPAASRVFGLLFVVAFGILLLLAMFKLPTAIVFGLVAIIPATFATYRVWKTPEETAKLIPAQQNTLLAFLLYALAVGAGLIAG